MLGALQGRENDAGRNQNRAHADLPSELFSEQQYREQDD
jgi:hypothetical protein